MLRYSKNDGKSNQQMLQKQRLIEKAVSKFTRKLEMMVDSKRSPDYIMQAASTYGLSMDDLTDKIKAYLGDLAKPAVKEEPAKKEAPKKAQAKSSKKSEASDDKEESKESSQAETAASDA